MLRHSALCLAQRIFFECCSINSAACSGLARASVVQGVHYHDKNIAQRKYHAASLLLATDISVPSMGDSITEGTIATILKQAGASVLEDEPVLQIETDKVTIDVRAPHAGILRALLVKEDETVAVGQVVAVLDEAEAIISPPAPSSSSPPPDNERGMSLEEKSDRAYEKTVLSIRRPLISFPPRRSAQGMVISAMPVVDQTTYKARSTAAQPPPSPQVSAMYMSEAPSKSGMSDSEMECINLGGALWPVTPVRPVDAHKPVLAMVQVVSSQPMRM